jgi:hypothetical protein
VTSRCGPVRRRLTASVLVICQVGQHLQQVGKSPDLSHASVRGHGELLPSPTDERAISTSRVVS